MTEETTTVETTDIKSVLSKLGIATVSAYVPHATPAGETPGLRWRVSVRRNGREFYSVEYFAGCGHAPSYSHKSGVTVAVREECETGYRQDGTPVRPPAAADVLHSLVMESEGLDGGFEDWAVGLGYDPDSRTAEGIYRKCCETAAAMKKAFSQDELAELAEAFRDY